MGALNFIEFFAQLLNPRNNPKGRFPGMGTHFAWLLTFEGHPPLILERLRDGDHFHPPLILERLSDGGQLKKVANLHGLSVGEKLLLGDCTHHGVLVYSTVVKIVKMDTIHHRVSLADVRLWLWNKKHQSYNLASNNCKHFAYDPCNVWSFLLITFSQERLSEGFF